LKNANLCYCRYRFPKPGQGRSERCGWPLKPSHQTRQLSVSEFRHGAMKADGRHGSPIVVSERHKCFAAQTVTKSLGTLVFRSAASGRFA
jgi:hypothetical protein